MDDIGAGATSSAAAATTRVCHNLDTGRLPVVDAVTDLHVSDHHWSSTWVNSSLCSGDDTSSGLDLGIGRRKCSASSLMGSSGASFSSMVLPAEKGELRDTVVRGGVSVPLPLYCDLNEMAPEYDYLHLDGVSAAPLPLHCDLYQLSEIVAGDPVVMPAEVFPDAVATSISFCSKEEAVRHVCVQVSKISDNGLTDVEMPSLKQIAAIDSSNFDREKHHIGPFFHDCGTTSDPKYYDCAVNEMRLQTPQKESRREKRRPKVLVDGYKPRIQKKKTASKSSRKKLNLLSKEKETDNRDSQEHEALNQWDWDENGQKRNYSTMNLCQNTGNQTTAEYESFPLCNQLRVASASNSCNTSIPIPRSLKKSRTAKRRCSQSKINCWLSIAEFLNTPKKKPRRKKHRPKVLVDGFKPRTQKKETSPKCSRRRLNFDSKDKDTDDWYPQKHEDISQWDADGKGQKRDYSTMMSDSCRNSDNQTAEFESYMLDTQSGVSASHSYITSMPFPGIVRKRRTRKGKWSLLSIHRWLSIAKFLSELDRCLQQIRRIDGLIRRGKRSGGYIRIRRLSLLSLVIRRWVKKKRYTSIKNLLVENEDSALVSYRSDGAIVPFIKKKHPKPKVYLDEETNRVWNLLLSNINNPGIDGCDGETTRRWKDERNVFRERADLFIGRMHLVQGDRRFSPWKGSVLDSVIGVFLTQNVSDHLSSSAFMELVAKFPRQLRSHEQSYHYKGAEVSKDKPESSVTNSSQSIIISHAEEDAENPVNENVLSRIIRAQILSGDSSYKSDPFDGELVVSEMSTYNSSILESIEETKCVTEDNRLATEDTVSSHYSIVSYQSFSNSLGETYGKTGLLCDENPVLLVGSDTRKCPTIKGSAEQTPPSNDVSCKKEASARKAKTRRVGRNINHMYDWDSLRKDAQENNRQESRANSLDSIDYEALRCADVSEIAEIIKRRGMNSMLAKRILDFVNGLVTKHGSTNLEWLRDVLPDQAKDYLLTVKGLGLKSVECVRLLTLHQLAFPVDTNIGRIAVRLGWVPLQPLPESLQLHLLEQYPYLETIQKYLWPRLCKLDQETLYELHYQMITFGKVFCTKSRPNCNACPMRGDCRHFASEYASSRLALPGPSENRVVNIPQKSKASQSIFGVELQLPKARCEPIIEEPRSPEPICEQKSFRVVDIEDMGIEDVNDYEDPDGIPTIKLNIAEFAQNLQNYVDENMEVERAELSRALVALTPVAASIPTKKLKNVSRLRTEHLVYELPESHPLLEKFPKCELDDPSPYLLAIWTPGETSRSIHLPETQCNYQESGMLCLEETCLSCNSARESYSQTIRGTILIPVRTAVSGSFPLNGTYFQVNEVFADHSSSHNPIEVPRDSIWNLPTRTVFFGTSVSTIFKGMSLEQIQRNFWRGFVCVRGIDTKTGAPRPLAPRLHTAISHFPKPDSTVHQAKGIPNTKTRE